MNEVTYIMIMIASCISDIESKTTAVSKLESTIKANLIKKYKTGEKVTVRGRFGMAYDKDVVSQEYHDMETKVQEAWNKTRKEHIPKEGKWDVSLSELITALLDSLNTNPSQYSFVSEKIAQRAIRSFYGHHSIKDTTMLEIQHARDLAFSFRDNIGIAKNPLLRRLYLNAKNDLILEAG